MQKMETKEITNIGEYFNQSQDERTLEDHWDLIVENWVNQIDQNKLLLHLFELRLWLSSLDEFFTSSYLEEIVFKFQKNDTRDYHFFLNTFHQICARLIHLLKALDIKKDQYLINFEEFIVERILESYPTKNLTYLKERNTPESWFYSLRLFLQSLRNLTTELTHNIDVSQRTYMSCRRLFHRELTTNPIILSLMKKRLIPKLDKVYQPDISAIINSLSDKNQKKQLGLFFIFSFRIMKIINFLEQTLNKTRYLDQTIPLILFIKKSGDNLTLFFEQQLKELLPPETTNAINNSLQSFNLELKKIYKFELSQYFDINAEKTNRRKLIKNIVIIADYAVKEMIESVASYFNPSSDHTIFENYVSRKQKASQVKKKLMALHSKINDLFLNKSRITSADIIFDLNLFIETDLNFLLYKDWNEFLKYFHNLQFAESSTEFSANLRSFHAFLTQLLKEIINV